jgi:AcrR family transcriptional regulator
MAADAREPAKPTSGKGSAQGHKPARADQRSRLLQAIVDIVAQGGYPQAKIGDLAKRAGVSRATFYKLFADKEECYLAAHRELAERMVSEVAQVVGESDPSCAAEATLTALVDFADREPLPFNFIMHEAMLAGPQALEERDRLITQLEEQIEHGQDQVQGSTPTPDLPAKTLLGGVIRALGIRMRRGQDHPRQLLADLIEWMDSYSVPRQAQRWSSITASAALLGANRDIAPRAMAPQPLPRGRHRLPVALVKRVQRERIRHATAEIIQAKGYANTTVADIVATAGLSREVFYAHFHDKREAFAETFKLVFEQTMVASAGAFFTSSGDWPERVWEGGRALANFLVATPSFAHLAFVEAYALGPLSAQLSDDFVLGFTVFLEDGYRYRPEAAKVPRLVSETIAGAMMETVGFYIRHDRDAELPDLLPLSTYMILAPFTGTDAACELVDRKMGEIRLGRTDKPGPPEAG